MKNTRFATTLLAVFLVSGLLFSCGNKEKDAVDTADEQLGKMEVEIPEVLRDNPEIVEYIEDMSVLVDDYAVLIDEMVKDVGDIAVKDWEELKIGEQLKLTRAAAEFAVKAGPLSAKWAEYEAHRRMVGQDLSEEEILALETVYERFEKRMAQIEEKNQDLFSGVES